MNIIEPVMLQRHLWLTPVNWTYFDKQEKKVSAKFCLFCPAMGLPYWDSASRKSKYYTKFAISNHIIKLKLIDYERGEEVD